MLHEIDSSDLIRRVYYLMEMLTEAQKLNDDVYAKKIAKSQM